jgi:hypothetical protein
VAFLEREKEPILTIVRHIDRIAALTQAIAEIIGSFAIILHKQDAHGLPASRQRQYSAYDSCTVVRFPGCYDFRSAEHGR